MQSVRRSDSSELLDMIIRRDYPGVCEYFLSRYFGSAGVPLWLFHRWDKGENRFTLLYPPLEDRNSQLSPQITARLENQKSLIDNNIPEIYGGWGETARYPATILVPLFYESELVGVAQGFSASVTESIPSAVSRDGLLLLAQSWQLLRLLEDKEKLAFTDSLTGLFNYQFLRQFLQNELTRCARYNKSASVVFLDVDWFKRVNDSHGHLIGSYVLKEMGKLLRGQVREADIVARYGGDEYVIVLTEIGLEGALVIAERLRQAVSAYVFAHRQGYSIRLTISAGVASFPYHGMTADELIRRSDMAMYQAKGSNKNCVKIAV